MVGDLCTRIKVVYNIRYEGGGSYILNPRFSVVSYGFGSSLLFTVKTQAGD